MYTFVEASDGYSLHYNLFAGDTKVCAGTGGRDTCNGDSGGPLLSDTLEVQLGTKMAKTYIFKSLKQVFRFFVLDRKSACRERVSVLV